MSTIVGKAIAAGGGATIGVTLNEDGTQNVLLSDNGTALDLAAGTADATATNEDVLEGKTFYSGGVKKTGTFVVPGPVLLWENPNPGAVFNPQKIALDLSEYSKVIISAVFSTGSPDVISAPIIVDKTNAEAANTGNPALVCGTVPSVDAYGISPLVGRAVAVFNDGVKFYVGKQSSSGTANNSACVPYRIWGVKFSL